MDLISLLVFVAVIVLAFVCKVNSGILAIAAAFILGRINGISDAAIMKMFDSKMFLMLLGVMYLFCIAQENKTLELLSKKILAMCHGKVKLFPPILFFLSAVLSAIGPGLISVTALMAAISVALAKECEVHPIKLMSFGTMGAIAGGLSSLAPSGIVGIEKAAENGIMGVAGPLMIHTFLTNLLLAVIVYFFVFKCHKLPDAKISADDNAETVKFTWKHWVTLAAILITAALTAIPGLNINVGLAAISMSVLLTILKVGNEEAALKKMPWGTLLLVTGVGVLISVVTELGGITLLSDFLSKLMTPFIATAIITLLAGVMSWFSSASGVVMPTLIKTLPNLAATIPGLDLVAMVIGISIGANLAPYSPLSTCGGLMLAAYTTSGVDQTARNKMFVQLFALSAGAVLLGAIVALTGMYSLFKF